MYSKFEMMRTRWW